MPNPDDLDLALVARLEADSTLQGLAPGGVFWDVAKQGAAEPFVIVNQQDHNPDYAMGAGAAVSDGLMYLVKAVGSGTAMAAVKAAAARIDVLLNRVSLTVTGYTTVFVERDSRVRYTEADKEGDRRWQHRGGIYRLLSGA